MPLSHEHVGSKISAKIKIYILNRAGLLFTLCNEITCSNGPSNFWTFRWSCQRMRFLVGPQKIFVQFSQKTKGHLWQNTMEAKWVKMIDLRHGIMKRSANWATLAAYERRFFLRLKFQVSHSIKDQVFREGQKIYEN